MFRWLNIRNGLTSFGPSVGAGLLFGVGMLVGILVTNNRAPSVEFPEQLLHATATHGSDSFAMATGPISDGVEGVFFLDYLTGDLRCQVINPRTGGLGGVFYHNVAGDLMVERSKQQKFLICTGMAQLRTGGGTNFQFAESIVYIADANTGNWVAYLLPWNKSFMNAGLTIQANLTVVGKGNARNLPKRDP